MNVKMKDILREVTTDTVSGLRLIALKFLCGLLLLALMTIVVAVLVAAISPLLMPHIDAIDSYQRAVYGDLIGAENAVIRYYPHWDFAVLWATGLLIAAIAIAAVRAVFDRITLS